MQTEKCTKIHENNALGQILITDERTPAEIPLCQREDDHIVKRVPEEFGAGQTMQILHAHSSSMSSLPRCYFMHEFSVNHMRTTNAHNSLSAQSDQPLCCLLLKNLFLSVLVLGPM